MSLNLSKNNFLGLIPARYNSKGFPQKNVKKVNNKFLIDYTIEAAINSKSLNYIYLNSESDKILNIGKKYPINLYKRNKTLSKDKTNANEIVFDFLKKIKRKISLNNLYIVYLQPTSPLRNSNHIDKAIKLFNKYKKVDSLVSGYKYSNKILKSFFVDTQLFLKPLSHRSFLNTNRQKLPNIFMSNGAIYIVDAKKFFSHKKFITNNTIFFEMNKRDSLDIDNKEDLMLFKRLTTK